MELHAKIDDDLMKDLMKELNEKKGIDVVKYALTVLRWALDQKTQSRVILSTDSTGGDVQQLVIPGITYNSYGGGK